MDRRALLDRYRTGYQEVADAVAGRTDAELDRPAPGGGWSARMVVHHLADSETNAYVRLRRLVAEDGPAIVGYDEEQWASRLHYDRPIDPSLMVLEAVRTASLQLLEALSPADWERTGTHSSSGHYSVDEWLRIYSEHSPDHADQIRHALNGDA